MNKSAIALAVAAALGVSAAYAETTLYGSARGSINYVDPDSTNFTDDDGDDNYWQLQNNSSRLGVRGSEDLGGGLSAIYQYEFGVNLMDGSNGGVGGGRPHVLGLRGGFGTVSIGRQWTPYYNVMGITDIFNNSFSFANYKGPFRISSSLMYSSPDFAGLKWESMANATGFDGGADEQDIDTHSFGLNYANAGFTAGGAYFKDDVDGERLWGVALGYGADVWSVAATYNNVDNNDDLFELDDYMVAGSYSFGSNIIRASWALNDYDEGGDVNFWQVGWQYNFSPRTRLWLEYVGVDADDDVPVTESSAVSLGMRHDF
jgi:predicted porin